MRRDRLGRRIGHNWWREFTVDVFRNAHQAWWQRAEAETFLYATEIGDFKMRDPEPTFKEVLVGYKGMERRLA